MRPGIKMIFLYLLVGMFSFPIEVSSQGYSLLLKNTPLREAIRIIERQSDYRFFFSDDAVDINQPVQIDISNATIEQILDEILTPYELGYQILENNLIVIKPHVVRRDIIITGIVTDTNGDILPGVNIEMKGTTTGTTTDVDGAYTIRIPNRNTVLSFSFVGYATQEIIAGNRTVVNVTLEENTYQMDEIIVTALGIKRAEKALSYNVQELKGDELFTVRNSNFINSLSGKLAGVQINSGAGGPGSAARVVMRGFKSLSKNNNALYVIDGIPMYNSLTGSVTDVAYFSAQPGTEAIADINPSDIESISLLTGPSAAALYGYEGANGVILITTKKGRADRTVITVSNSTTFSTPMMMPKFQNNYGNMAGETESWGSETLYRFNPVTFFNTGSNISNSVSLATGNEQSLTYFSMASVNANSILPNNLYDRYNFTFRNTTSFLNDKLVLDVGVNYIVQKDKNMVSQGQYFNPLPALYLFPRGENFDEVRLFERYDALSGLNTQFWPYGDQGLSLQNPYWIMRRMDRESNKKRYRLSAGLQYHITDWFNVIGRINTDNTDFRYTEKRYAGTLATFAGTKGYYRLENRREQQVYADVIANIDKYAGDFSIHVNMGASIKDYRMDNHYIRGDLDKITNWFTTENIDRARAFKIDDDGKRQQAQSIFANTETGYKNMVYLTLTGRNDWDSALAFSKSGVKSFFYPSAGLSGIISQMLTLPRWFTYLKVRVAFTSVGTPYDPYITRERYEYDEQTDQYHPLPLYPNPNLKPELTNSFETGLNMRFFRGMLRLDATWYNSHTLNQTFIAELPTTSPYSGVYVQAGDVQNSGVELALEFDRKWSSVAWNTHITYSFNKNIIKKLANGTKNPVNNDIITMPYLNKATLGSGGSPEVRLLEGGSMGDIYVKRDWQRDENGLIVFNEDFLPFIIDSEYQKVGSVLPNAHAGWKNSVSFKGITLNVLISGRFGGKVVSNTQAVMDRYGVSEYSAQLREKGMTLSSLTIPARDYLNIIAAGTGQGAHYVYNATNIRLGELSILYTIPKARIGYIADITVGLTGSNLAMICCKAPFDPELAASVTNTYYTGVDYFMQPALRNIGVTVRVQF